MTEYVSPSPDETPITTSDGTIPYDWSRFFNNLFGSVNSLIDASLNSNLMLNGTFHFNDGVSTPVNQVDGDGAYVSEKWQVNGASNADYTITSTQYTLESTHKTTSSYYQDINISNYTGGDVYLYQVFIGINAVRLVQGRTISFSGVFNNVSANSVSIQFGLYRNYDPSDDLVKSMSVILKPGFNLVRSSIVVPMPTGITAGASPYLEVRAYITRFTDACHITAHYIKAEFGANVTPNITDNFIERSRINNS